MIPRSLDRGLIEARELLRLLLVLRRFPGLLIGASLKRDEQHRRRHQHAQFPGLLIGASLKRALAHMGAKR